MSLTQYHSAIERGDITAALGHLRQLADHSPADADGRLFLDLARAWYDHDRHGDALAALDVALARLPGEVPHPYWLGEARGDYLAFRSELLENLGRHDEAWTARQEAARLADPCGNASERLYQAGRVALQRGDTVAAGRHWFQQCLRTNGGHSDEILAAAQPWLDRPLEAPGWCLALLIALVAYRDHEPLKRTHPDLVATLLPIAEAKTVDDPELQIWLIRLRGIDALDREDHAEAARCYRECVTRGPAVDVIPFNHHSRYTFEQQGVDGLRQLNVPTAGGSAQDYYNLGCLLYERRQEADDPAAQAEWLRLAQQSYEHGRALFERHLPQADGPFGNAGTHTYSMLLNNLGICLRLAGRAEEAVAAHDQGIAVSEFYEHWTNRQRCLLDLRRWSDIYLSMQALRPYLREGYGGDEFISRYDSLLAAAHCTQQPLDAPEIAAEFLELLGAWLAEHGIDLQPSAGGPAADADDELRDSYQNAVRTLIGLLDFCRDRTEKAALHRQIEPLLTERAPLTTHAFYQLWAAYRADDLAGYTRQLQAQLAERRNDRLLTPLLMVANLFSKSDRLTLKDLVDHARGRFDHVDYAAFQGLQQVLAGKPAQARQALRYLLRFPRDITIEAAIAFLPVADQLQDSSAIRALVESQGYEHPTWYDMVRIREWRMRLDGETA